MRERLKSGHWAADGSECAAGKRRPGVLVARLSRPYRLVPLRSAHADQAALAF